MKDGRAISMQGEVGGRDFRVAGGKMGYGRGLGSGGGGDAGWKG
eukprot:CAMPEP_0172331000 /NCGR_PEP_ID=MMETSP1058-20130122/61700_1 /TAXON_ID=83371 /ORGANISM="Detonula confervacea, Strain CCMP 353" /LENGTH=43 /DNA_ID= /DNA_START= /DNA_END= /DNA_ORIENTATION=